MRRPILPLLFGMALGVYLADALGLTNQYLQTKEAMMIAICIVAASIFVIYGKFGNGGILGATLIAALVGAILCIGAANEIKSDLDNILAASDDCVTGLITDVSDHAEYVGFTVKTECGASVQVNVYDEIEQAQYFEGCRGTFYGKTEEPKGQRNPHCFDYRRYLSTKGICAVSSAKSYSIGEVVSPARHFTAKWKAEFIDNLTRFSDKDTSSLVAGILFGDKGTIDEEIYDTFRKNGTAHILAVSGLHIGIIYAFACKLLRGRRTRKARIFTSLFVLVYITVAGFAPSTTRAGAMILLHILSKELQVRYDMLSAASFVCMVNMAVNPLIFWNTGFQMSYLAIFTISFVVNRLNAWNVGSSSGSLRSALSGGIGIQLGLAPYTAFEFNYFSIASLFVNIPVIYLAGLMVPLSIVMLYLSPFCEIGIINSVFGFCSFTIFYLCKLLCYLNDLAYMGGHSSFVCASPRVWIMILYYGVLFFACSEAGFIAYARRNWRKIITVLLLIVILAFACNAIYTVPADRAGLVFVDVGQGDCLHIRTEDGKNLLIDSGGSYFTSVGEKTLKPYLLKNGCSKLDLVVITHLHTDHCAAVAEICDEIEIGKLCVYEGYSLEDVRTEIPEYSGPVDFLKKGDMLRISKDVAIEILAPGPLPAAVRGTLGDTEDENAISLITKVHYKGMTAMMTADIDTAGEMQLVQGSNRLKCDILKIAHHGSKYSSCEAFLRAVSPAAAVIQVGKNNYGHPAPEVLEKCASLGIAVYRNDLDGAVCVVIDRKGNYRIFSQIH